VFYEFRALLHSVYGSLAIDRVKQARLYDNPRARGKICSVFFSRKATWRENAGKNETKIGTITLHRPLADPFSPFFYVIFENVNSKRGLSNSHLLKKKLGCRTSSLLSPFHLSHGTRQTVRSKCVYAHLKCVWNMLDTIKFFLNTILWTFSWLPIRRGVTVWRFVAHSRSALGWHHFFCFLRICSRPKGPRKKLLPISVTSSVYD